MRFGEDVMPGAMTSILSPRNKPKDGKSMDSGWIGFIREHIGRGG